jgi:phage terminase large subunit-like protein
MSRTLDIGGLSRAEQIALLPADERNAFIKSLTKPQLRYLPYAWFDFWARPKQFFPSLEDDWHTLLICAGRGFGKTRSGAEDVRYLISEKNYRWISIVGRTAADVRDVMIEGQSGLLSVFPPHQRPHYEPSKRRITFHTGAIGTTFSADEPDQMRGPQSDLAWCDELAAWRYAESWDQVNFGNRLGDRPIKIVTTTPRPTLIMRELIGDHQVIKVTGSTYENARNLAPSALAYLKKKYEGTTLGQQELDAKLLTDTPGALWKRRVIDALRVIEPPPMKRIVVAIDPSATSHEDSSETGIIVAGLGINDHGYVLEDVTLRGSPTEWATQAIAAYHKYTADRIIAEVNNGGDMVETVIRSVNKSVSFSQVRASRGKATRAEPVSALYEQGLVHHLGAFAELEDQMVTWVTGEKSPDRMDALVWAISELMIDEPGEDNEPVIVRRMRTKWG